MAEIGAWYEKYGAAGVLADPGHQLDFPHTAKTVRAGGVTDGPYIEAKEVLAPNPCWKRRASTRRWRSRRPGRAWTGAGL